MRKLDLLLSASVLVSVSASAGDWPRFRGANFDGVSQEKNWLGAWPGGQPKQLWKKNVGTGFSSLVVAEGRVFTVGHAKDQDTLYCFHADTGAEIWKHAYAQKLDPKYYDGGPSATPTVEAGKVYHLSKQGDVFCLDAATGQQVWHANVRKLFGVEEPEWGFAGSPHIEGDLVILNAGTHGVALKKADGSKAWTSGKDAAGYATPVPFVTNGRRALAVFAAKGLSAVDPATGQELWSFPWRTEYDVNSPDPVVVSKDQVFITSGYKFLEKSNSGGSGALLKLGANGAEKVWHSKELGGQLVTPVVVNGLIFGIHGQVGEKGAKLRCLDPKTGKMLWESPSAEPGGLTAADGKLIWVTGPGELVIVEATGGAYKELARAQVIGSKVWSAPVLANGKVYVRNSKGDVVCVDVKTGGPVG